jgi:hypothetical protein
VQLRLLLRRVLDRRRRRRRHRHMPDAVADEAMKRQIIGGRDIRDRWIALPC